MFEDAIDLTQAADSRQALVCARLYLRNGKRRLQKGFSVKAITALYDTVWFGMLYYISRHDGCAPFIANTELWDAPALFQVLTRAGVFEDHLAFNRLSLTVERILWQRSSSFDTTVMLMEVEGMLTKLGVIAFKKSASVEKSKISH